jgi:hypothetical protein
VLLAAGMRRLRWSHEARKDFAYRSAPRKGHGQVEFVTEDLQDVRHPLFCCGGQTPRDGPSDQHRSSAQGECLQYVGSPADPADYQDLAAADLGRPGLPPRTRPPRGGRARL